jgi:hypothetical protein
LARRAFVLGLALVAGVPQPAAPAPAEDVTFQLAKTLKKPDVVYVLTNDAEAKQLRLSDADWKMFMSGRLAAEPPRRTVEEPPLFHQAFDSSTTVSVGPKDLLRCVRASQTVSIP